MAICAVSVDLARHERAIAKRERAYERARQDVIDSWGEDLIREAIHDADLADTLSAFESNDVRRLGVAVKRIIDAHADFLASRRMDDD